MPETFVIRTGKTTRRWLKLLEHLQHSSQIAVRCVFENETIAKRAYGCFMAMLRAHPSQLTVVVHIRGREVYVFKPEHFDKAVIDDA